MIFNENFHNCTQFSREYGVVCVTNTPGCVVAICDDNPVLCAERDYQPPHWAVVEYCGQQAGDTAWCSVVASRLGIFVVIGILFTLQWLGAIRDSANCDCLLSDPPHPRCLVNTQLSLTIVTTASNIRTF